MDATFHDKTARLMDAIHSGSMPDLQAAISLGPPWRAAPGSSLPFAPLCAFLRAQWEEGMEALLVAGFPLEERDENGQTPLHLSITMAELTAMERLLDAGADLAARGARGDDALHLAASNPWQPAEAVARLLARRSNWPQRVDSAGRCALMAACVRNNLDAALLLIEAGFKVDFRGPHDDTPLSCAAAAGNVRVLDALLARGAHPDGGWAPGAATTPLTEAIQQGAFSCVKSLLNAGASLWLPLADGTTALTRTIANTYGNADRPRDLLHERVALEEALALRAEIAQAPARAAKSGL